MADVATAPMMVSAVRAEEPEQQPEVEVMEVDPVPETSEQSADATVAAVPAAVVAEEQKSEELTEHERIMAKIKPSSFGEKRKYSRIDISSENWLLTMDDESRAKLETPPSLPKIDLETEQDLRFLGCELIQYGSTLLKLPQTAAATAQILYQRFYYQKSFARHHFEYSVMACLLLASKIEEAPRRPRDVLNVFNYLEHYYRRRHTAHSYKEYQPMAIDAKYVQMKNQVIKMERRILCALGFVVHVKHPHKLIVSYAYTLKCSTNYQMMQKAWSYMNDGLRTDMFLRYKAETIACACIHLAARTVEPKVPLPMQPFMWFELYDVSERDVEDITLILLKMYTRTQTPNWNRLLDVIDKARFGDEPPPEAAKEPKTEEPVVKTKAILAAEEIIKKAREEAIREGRLRADGSDVSTPGTGDNKRNKHDRVTTMTNGRDKDRERDRDHGRRRRHRSASSSHSDDRKRSHKRSKHSRNRDRGEPDRDHRNGRDYEREKNRDRRDRRRSKSPRDRNRDKDRDSRKSEKEKSRLREKEVVQTLRKRRTPSPSDIRDKRK